MNEQRAFDRTFALEDIAIRSEGDGRTVDAYAAVFNREAEIVDWDGHFLEVIRPGAFRKTIQENGGRFKILFNHGRTIHGLSSERFGMPVGVPEDVHEDRRGLRTTYTLVKTELGDEVLELIRAGAIDAMSFSGRFMQSRFVKATAGRKLDLVERTEIALREFGPVVFPAYKQAAIVGVRAEDLAAYVQTLDAEGRAELRTLLDAQHSGTEPDPAATGTGPDPVATPPSEPPQHSARQLRELELDRLRLEVER